MSTLESFFESLEEDDLEGDVSSFESPTEVLAKQALADYERLSSHKLPFELFAVQNKYGADEENIYTCPFWKVCPGYPIIKDLLSTLEFRLEIRTKDSGDVYGVELQLMIWGNHIVENLLEYGIVDEKLILVKVGGKYVNS